MAASDYDHEKALNQLRHYRIDPFAYPETVLVDLSKSSDCPMT